ncbi:MAG: DUF805 domain-containing protein [Chloracidobacterium sp.]|nr:DUF805 domain-containing protein [Chloracidobacterium sp.]
MNWYLGVLKKYAVFSGRARRKEYWIFALFNLIFVVVAVIIDNVLGLTIEDVGYGPVYILYALATFVPSLAVTVRRLHDTGKSGWFILVALIPCVGGIALLVFGLTPGDVGANEYGEDPKAHSEYDLFGNN